MQNTLETSTANSWLQLSTFEQLVHIGRSIDMAINCRKSNDQLGVNAAIAKAIELLELTIIDSKNIKRLGEITKIKMLLIDDFRGNNEYYSTDEWWRKYFSFFEHLVKTGQEK